MQTQIAAWTSPSQLVTYADGARGHRTRRRTSPRAHETFPDREVSHDGLAGGLLAPRFGRVIATYPIEMTTDGEAHPGAARRAGPATWPSGVVPLARKALASRVVKGARSVQGIRHLAPGTRVRVVGEHPENFWYEVELEDGGPHLWVDIDAVQPERRREVVRRSAGPGTGLGRRDTHRLPDDSPDDS